MLQVADDEVYLVVNAGCREKDLAHINKHLEKFQVKTAMQLAKASERHMQHKPESCMHLGQTADRMNVPS